MADMSDEASSYLQDLGVDPNNMDSATLPEDSVSPLASVNITKKSSGSSPLSNKLYSRAEEIAPKREDVVAKREALMTAFNNLMNAQRFREPAVQDPEAVATAATLLKSHRNSDIATGLGSAMEAGAGVRQGWADKKAAAETAQAGTGIKAADTNLGFSTEDQKNELGFLQQAGASDYKNEMLQMRMALAGLGKKQIVKDQSGNPYAIFDKATGTLQPLNGSGGGAGGATTPSGVPIISVPGVDPKSPAHAGISQILSETGIDPSSITNRTRPELSQATKDASAARTMLDSANSASKIAEQVEKVVDKGFPGGFRGGAESMMNAALPASMQMEGPSNRDYINKKSNEMASAIAKSLPGMRIGVGMENFLKNSTFNTDIGVDAIKKILSNYKDLPFVAQANMDLENITNKLPTAAKNAVYGEFLKDNPPFIQQEDKSVVLNPVYKDKNLIKSWFTKRAGLTQQDPNQFNAGGSIPEGIDPKVWEVMAPEDKALWKK